MFKIYIHTEERKIVTPTLKQTGTAITTLNTWCIVFKYKSFIPNYTLRELEAIQGRGGELRKRGIRGAGGESRAAGSNRGQGGQIAGSGGESCR